MVTSSFIASPSRVRLAIILPDYNAIRIFRHLCFALRMADPDLPEVLRNPDIAFFPADDAGSDRSMLSPLIATLTLLERRYAGKRESDSIVESVLKGKNRFVLVTSKASFFNYLSPRLIDERLGVRLDLNDRADVPVLVAQALHAKNSAVAWELLDADQRKRLVGYAEDVLAEQVAPAMTPELLQERRAKADVGRWLDAIKRLILW